MTNMHCGIQWQYHSPSVGHVSICDNTACNAVLLRLWVIKYELTNFKMSLTHCNI